MSATTEQKARFLDLVTGTLEMVRDGKRAIEPILTILQGIKDEVNFAQRLLAKTMIIWKTIMVGGLSKDKLLKRLVDSGRNVSDWAKDIMSKSAFKTSTKPHEVSFVRVKVRDLGFTQNPTTTELFARIKEVGELCQPEDGPWLALQDQPCGDIFWLAMEPITDSGGGPGVFSVGRDGDGGRWLGAVCADPDSHWSLDGEIVFRSRK